MESAFHSRAVFITGGAGAFGQKCIRYLNTRGTRGMTVFSRDEMKHAALKRSFASAMGPALKCVIGDITRPDELALAMDGADVVIHAAAMKHLPECEANVAASTLVNVAGTQHVVNAFLRSKAETLVFLSTDKAPYASSVYGAQKYMGEKIVTEAAARAPEGKRAFSLRYSNVLDSTGAVFNIFGDMLKAGKKVTVNGSQTIRGFVSQDEVLANLDAALGSARGGENIVLRPRVIRISELASAMCEIIGTGEVEIKETTTFLGEKDSATLIMDEERGVAKEFGNEGRAYLLDYLRRNEERRPANFRHEGSLTLEHCETVTGGALREYLLPVMKANGLIA